MASPSPADGHRNPRRDPPGINDKFPIGKALSPPLVSRPIPACAEAVYVTGFVGKATVRVYANAVELLAEKNPTFAFAEISLNRPLRLGDSITATQTVLGITSDPSIRPVVVSATLDSDVQSTKPKVGDDLYQCGRVVPVDHLVAGVRVQVFEDDVLVGDEPAAQPWHPVLTSPLHAGGRVTAQQVACEGTTHEIKGPRADLVIVHPAPSPPPPPQVDGGSMVPQGNTVTLDGLLVGASVDIFASGMTISSGWLATSDRNYFPVNPPLTGDSVTAIQTLCGKASQPSEPVNPSGKLSAPLVLSPICNGSRFVVVRGTTINAIVVVMRNGTPVGYAGAAKEDLVVGLGSGQTLSTGDVVTAIQYMGPNVSPLSNAPVVVSSLLQPAVEILGGEPFFLPKAGEQAIDGPVFPRGRGSGPVFQVQACCGQGAGIQVFGPKGDLIGQPSLVELFPGYYTATLSWSTLPFASIPGDVPVGKYMAIVHSACSEKNAEVPFYVIFNPNDVDGPPRFSFDDTTVWFGAIDNTVYGLHYYLHQSDNRVFQIAINAVSGFTDSFTAASAVARAEEDLFSYSLSYHSNDVLDMITHFTEAQCADDASCLTSLLRAVGIPAHNVTADAAIETGQANWTFDTWVEFLATQDHKTDWRIFHPHQFPGMSPESRSTFGTTRGVATKEFNDVIVMAGQDWDLSQLDDGVVDVSFTRNACGEPIQNITKAPWIVELCESGYWSKTHWDCTGVNRNFRSERGFRIAGSSPVFGGRLTGAFDVVNRRDIRDFGTVSLEVVSSLPESKQFPDEQFDSVRTPVVLDPGASITLPFNLCLPETLKPGHKLYLWAHRDGHTVHRSRITIPSGISCEFILLPVGQTISFRVGDEYTVRVKITNLTDHMQRLVDVELQAPYAVLVENAHHRCVELRPCESLEFSWPVRAVAPLRSGSLQVSVATAKAGGTRLARPFTVTEVEKRPLVGLPAVQR